MRDFARSRVDGISETIVYTTGATEKSATALRRRIMVPAVQEVAVVGLDGMPIPPAMLLGWDRFRTVLFLTFPPMRFLFFLFFSVQGKRERLIERRIKEKRKKKT